jgi:NADPH2:quinone reductase
MLWDMSFQACRVFDDTGYPQARVVSMEPAELRPGDVLIRARFSGLNYKDALAVTGRGKILRRFPLNAGIDVAGTVESSSDDRFKPGDAVLVNGMGLGETHDGGFAEIVRVPGDWIVPLPAGLSAFEAMALGTAGFTAALALYRMEQLGQQPGQDPIVVTGASGGVGSIAVSILAARGYPVLAVSGRAAHHAYLRELGASAVKTPEELQLGSRALESARFAGAIDNVGGTLLAGLTRHVGLWGNIASVGNAGGPELETTVFPLILRGVSVLGISSTNCPMPLRAQVWNRLGTDLKPGHLDAIVSGRIPLAAVPEAAQRLLDRGVRGRIVVTCASGD